MGTPVPRYVTSRNDYTVTFGPPQQPFRTPVAYRDSTTEQPPKEPAVIPGQGLGNVLAAWLKPIFSRIAEAPSAVERILNNPELGNVLATSLKHIFFYIAEVLSTVAQILKYPISIALAIIACAYALAIMSDAVRSALAPMCSIPVVSLLCPATAPAEPSQPSNPVRTPLWADFPNLVKVEIGTLESLLDETVEGPGLSLEIMKAERVTSDLATRVRVSNMDSHEILADSLSEFVKDARKVSRGLTRFSSRVRGAVDTYVVLRSTSPQSLTSDWSIIAVNDYALHCIEAANPKPSGLMFMLKRLWSSGSSEVATKQVVTQTFTKAMDVLSANMQRLMLEAEVLILDLNKLEKHLKSIQEVVSREDLLISSAKNELLAHLWTILGGNRDQLRGMDEHLALLKGVGEDRDRALDHVVAALEMLRSMAEDMEELRERVAAPELVSDAIPIDVHIKSLRSGLERLKGRRGADRVSESEGAKVTRA